MKKYKPKSLKVILFSAAVMAAVCIGVCSCKVWRTVSTSATYVQQNDSAKTTTSIATKTTEEYVGNRKK